MKKIKKVFNWFGIALICRWSIWLIAFVPAVNKAWYELVSTPETGPQIHEIVARIGENPVWQMAFYQILGVPGACMFLSIYFLKKIFAAFGDGIYAMYGLIWKIKVFMDAVFRQPLPRLYNRHYLRLIEGNEKEYVIHLKNGQTTLPDGWGKVSFDIDQNRVKLYTEELDEEHLHPNQERILQRREADALEKKQTAVLIYCPIRVNWPSSNNERRS